MAVSATGTGNVYEFNAESLRSSSFDSWVSQSDAAFAASQLSYNGVEGHLVTISQEEQDAVESLFLQPFNHISQDQAMAGFTLVVQITKAGEMVWNQGPETGTAFSYTNWWADTGGPLSGGHSEPGGSHDSPYGEEDAVAIHPALVDSSGDTGLWFDIRDYAGSWESGADVVSGYIVEYEAPPLEVTFNPSGDKAYHFVSEAMTWLEAKAYSETLYFGELQGYFANPSTAGENALIYNLARESFPDSFIWIGGSDEANQGEFVWASGPEAETIFALNHAPDEIPQYNALTGENFFVNFSEHVQANTTEHYLNMSTHAEGHYYPGGGWMDADYRYEFPFVVEFDMPQEGVGGVFFC